MSGLSLASVVGYLAPFISKDLFILSMIVLYLETTTLLYRSLERYIETLDTVH
jgi:hypothetical protein